MSDEQNRPEDYDPEEPFEPEGYSDDPLDLEETEYTEEQPELDPVEEDDDYSDSDVPFRLPKSEGYEGNIHKEDTADIDVPTDFYEQATRPREVNDDDDGLQTGDLPYEIDGTVPNPALQDDEDIPFRLPQNDGTPDPTGKVGNKWVTMPNERQKAQTLPGSGGLDPNPDFVRMEDNTVQSQNRRNNQPQYRENATQHDQQRYQRPVQGPPRTASRTIPPAPQTNAAARPLPRRNTRRRRRRNMGCWALVLGLFVTFCGGFTLFSVVAGGFAYARVGELLNERIDKGIGEYSQFQSTFLYDRNGEQLFEVFNEGRRTTVSIEQMPLDLINATIAIEDDSFYRNIGVDIPATMVAFLGWIGASNEETPGGSTITQQLVRNVLFDPQYRAERSAQRKAEEIALALALTGRKSKNEILELYLNEIYYGNLAYGAQAAANVFFDKDVSELTLGEAALLAGLPQLPAELDPLSPDPNIRDAVDRRWRQVLTEMVEEGFITQDEMNTALSEGLEYRPQDVPLEAPHFTVFAQVQFERLMSGLGYSTEDVAKGGFQVYTSVDLDLNNEVQRIARDQVATLVNNNASNGAVVVLKPRTGEVLAMVGSIDYNNDAIDGRVNVTTALRQPGSTMKPFTYSAAIERGFTFGDVLWDTRISIDQPGQAPYTPRNYDGGFHGPLRIRQALANSYNIPAVQAIRYAGVDYVLQLLSRFGVESLGTDASRYGVSLTLGGGDISPLELTRAYSVFANNGALVETQAIICVIDNEDNIIFQYEDGCPRGTVTESTVVRAALGKQVLDPRIAFVISDILGDNNARTPAMGGNSPLYTPNIVSSVKTGTTNDVKDNWTVGYTRNVAIGVWIGNNNGDPMTGQISGLAGAAPIWNSVLNLIYGTPDLMDEFRLDGQLLNDERIQPSGVSLTSLCDIRTGYISDPVTEGTGCPRQINEWLLDSPAGVPDGQGNMSYPPAIRNQMVQPTTGSFVELIQPGVYRTVVIPIAPEVAAGIRFSVGPGQETPPPPKYCRLPVEYWSAPPAGARMQYFIAPPAVPGDAVSAENYANNNNLPFLPTIDCNDTLINAGPIFSSNVTGQITSPQNGDTVIPPTAIFGTANFAQDGASYYKFALKGGSCCADWTPMTDVNHTPVINGQLGSIPALESGSYQIRLEIIGPDGNAAMNPYEVSFTVP